MKRILNDPRHWELRAKETRALAESVVDEVAKGELLKIAQSYQRMAERSKDHALVGEA